MDGFRRFMPATVHLNNVYWRPIKRQTMRKKTLIALVIVLLLGITGFLVWASTPLGPSPAALAALQSDAAVSFSQDYWLIFAPTQQTPRTGLVLYPGARVDPRSYAPAAHAIAQAGYLVVITPMPLNLAVLNPAAAGEVIAAYPDIENWAVGGHSLGGAMAARFVFENPQGFQGQPIAGLVLWAAYPASTDDLTQRDLAVSSIYGEQDGLADPETVTAARFLLPASTVWTPIAGGNHAQFGSYGKQAGDQPAGISPAEQEAEVVQATIALLAKISRPLARETQTYHWTPAAIQWRDPG